MTTHKAITTARLLACRKQPALTSAILSLIPVEKKGLNTCAVDMHWRMYYDPAFVGILTPDELGGIVLHEVMHLVLRHAPRAQAMCPPEHRGMGGLSNIAADLAVNSILRTNQIALPKDAVYPEQFKLPQGKAFESYYHSLIDQQEKDRAKEDQPTQGNAGVDEEEATEGNEPGAVLGTDEQEPDDGASSPGTAGTEDSADAGAGDGHGTDPGDAAPAYDPPKPGQSGSCSDGQPRPWEDGPPSEAAPGLTESEQKQIVREVAERVEKAQGKGTCGALAEWAKTLLNPKVDPRVLLMHAMRKAVDEISGQGGEFTYRRASRRSYPGGVLRPREMQPVPRITALLDTSGSMSATDFGWALGLIDKLLNSFRLRDGIRVLVGDCQIHQASKCFDAKQIDIIGGGGTDVGEMLVAAYESAPKGQKPALMLALTDGFTPWGQTPLPCKVIACLTQASEMKRVPKWIRAIHIGKE